jgi:SAM-dependent methyltransferase
VDGIPVLIDEQASIFSLDDFVSHRTTFVSNAGECRVKTTLRRWLPTIDRNLRAKANYRRMSSALLEQSPAPRVLVLGGGILGQGLEELARNTAVDLVESDVSFGPRTRLICDAHDLPFPDETFDGVVVQAVLEHVVDPYRCAAEIHRVLKPRGIVYAETPFVQQVHGGRYDFTRFTHLGHRRLFRRFEEMDSGAVCGPAMALAWSYQYFLLSFTTSRTLRLFLRVFARLTAFPLKYVDYYLANRPAALDATAVYYFMGRKSGQTLPDRDLIQQYRGAI